MTWRKILKDHGDEFLAWLDEGRALETALQATSHALETVLRNNIRTADDAITFWNAIPMVRAACDSPSTYELPLAAEAYAYVHCLDRYWRTFDVLVHLTELRLLPLGKHGVRLLDIGSGPGATPYAVQDYYALLRNFAEERQYASLAAQALGVSIVERSEAMRHFLHYFSELSNRDGPFGARHHDFSSLDLRSKRRSFEKHLRREEWFEPETGESYFEHTPQEANHLAQSQERYRFVCFSNFFTLGTAVQAFETPIRRLLIDLQHGATVIVLGAKARSSYLGVYQELARIAIECGLRPMVEVGRVLGEDSYSRVAEPIKAMQHRVYLHAARLVGAEALSQDKDWPDYWSAKPHAKKTTAFSLTLFRKGRWPKPLG